jgi:hypothetical protein
MEAIMRIRLQFQSFSLCTLILLTHSEILQTQVSESWSARYNGPGSSTDNSYAISVDHTGSVFVTGSSPSAGFGTEDYATIKYDSAGTQQWAARYNGTGGSIDIAYAIAVDEDGSIYVTGGSTGSGSGLDFLTIKYSSAGDTVWTRRYNGPKNDKDVAYSICLDDSGNVYVTGESEGSTGTHGIFEDYTTIKYNPHGVQRWISRYNGPAGDYDKANSVDVDPSGNVYVTGVSDGGSSGSGAPHFDYATIKYNNIGLVQWIRRHNGSDNALDEGKSVKVDILGNVVVTGSSKNLGSSDDYFTIKYTSSGDTVWFSKYNGTGNSTDIANNLAIDDLGNTFVTGKSYGGSTNNYDIVTIKYDSTGDSVSVNRYNGEASGIDEGIALAVDGSGNSYITGYSSGITTGFDYTIIKYSSSGIEEWIIKYTNSGAAGSSEQTTSIFVDSFLNVYVTGMSALDYATVKYIQSSTAVDDNLFHSPDRYILSQNFPNPFNPTTKIRYSIAESNFASIKVYDMLGNEVARLINEEQLAGNYEVDFNASELSSGIYFYQLQAGSFIETKKMILLK